VWNVVRLKDLKLGFAVLSMGLVSGCETGTEIVVAGSSTVIVDTPDSALASGVPSPAPSADPATTVCDPFTNNPSHPGSDLNHGIVASIKYLSDSMPRYSKATDYQKNGVPLDATLFFTDVNVPTRSFSLGFATQSGNLLLNDKGNTLYEYFSVHMESQLQLTLADPVGSYQLAILSDDGSLAQIDRGSGFEVWVNNDGVHSTRFTAATQPLLFASTTTRIPIQVDYFQGPRYHIAMILLWRPWPSTGSTKDPLEGKSGNTYFFDPDQVPSVPTSAYNALLSRGWKPVSAANFYLPEEVAQNPCHVANPVTTQIDSTSLGTASSTLSTSITFNFSSNYAAATFMCRMDSGTYSPCLSPITYSHLAVGNHQFDVYAIANNQTDPVGTKFQWSILPGATTSITSMSPSVPVSNQTSFTVAFASNYSTATFSCQLDTGTLSTCVSPATYSNLGNGAHTFKVFAAVPGSSDSVGASYSWTVDTVAPVIQSGFGVTATSTSFTVTWVTNEPSTSKVNWGAGTSTATLYQDSALVTSHSVTLTGLTPSTVYSYIFGGSDQAGNSVSSSTNRVRTNP
jgi:hypothetical protein